jgi:hypothetical protein
MPLAADGPLAAVYLVLPLWLGSVLPWEIDLLVVHKAALQPVTVSLWLHCTRACSIGPVCPSMLSCASCSNLVHLMICQAYGNAVPMTCSPGYSLGAPQRFATLGIRSFPYMRVITLDANVRQVEGVFA